MKGTESEKIQGGKVGRERAEGRGGKKDKKASESQVVRETEGGEWWREREREKGGGHNQSNVEAKRNSCQHHYCKIMDFLLIIPPLLRFTLRLSYLSASRSALTQECLSIQSVSLTF